MFRLEYANQFKKDFKKITKMPIPDIIEVGHIIYALQQGETLLEKYVDHPLSGNWANYHGNRMNGQISHNIGERTFSA